MKNMQSEDFSIGTASNVTGLSQTTIRYWEKIGLIKSQRTDGGHRRYSHADIRKLKQLKQDKDKQGIPATELESAAKLVPVSKKSTVRPEGIAVNPLNKVIIQRELDIRFSKGVPTSACFVELSGKEDFTRVFGQKGLFKILHFIAYLLDDTVRDYGKGDEKLAFLGKESYVLVTDPKGAPRICRRLVQKFKQFFELQLGEDEFSRSYLEGVKRGEIEGLALVVFETNNSGSERQGLFQKQSYTLDELRSMAEVRGN